MIALKLGQFKDDIVDISMQATQEDKLESEYTEVEKKWSELQLNAVEYTRQDNKVSNAKVLSGIDDLNTELDEILANMNNILGSRYLKKLRKKAEELQRNVLNAQDTLGDWVQVQKNWMYLENLFTSPEIKSTMPEENTSFEKVDKFFKDQMKKVDQHRLLSKVIDKGSKKAWEKNKDILNTIQKALDALLETKRNVFPRFYFLSNDELLEIMANPDVSSVEKNLKKCFDGIHKVKCEGVQITHLISPEGERIHLKKMQSTTGSVETWLASLENHMRENLKDLIKRGKKDYDMADTSEKKQEWVKSHIA